MGINIILEKTIINNSNCYNIIALKQKKNHKIISGKVGIINKNSGYILINKKKLLNYILNGASISPSVYKYLDNINIINKDEMYYKCPRYYKN